MHRTRILALSLTASSITACDEARETPAPDAGPTVQALAACDESDFEATPFMGPAFDATTGAAVGPLPTPYVVATTAGWARPEERHRSALGQASEQVSEAIFESPGLLGVSFGGSTRCDSARTLSLWTDEAAMLAFVRGAAHGAAMPLVPSTTLGWETTRWPSMDDAPPTWQSARDRLAAVRRE